MQTIYQWLITNHVHHPFIPAIYINLFAITIAVVAIISLYMQIRKKQRPIWLHIIVMGGCAYFIWQLFF
jgi:hypothetical protein